ncbi:MAG: GldG family protein, partial [Oscillospiraceae bacterium]|nr:GldG family protein [Oscillospiraceae bacterium]
MRKIAGFFNRRKFKYGALSAVMAAAFVAVVVLANIVAGVLIARLDLSIDWSHDGRFSIENSTAAFLAALDDDVTLTVTTRESEFAGNGAFYNQTNEILRRFAGANERITLEYKDLLSNPEFAAQFAGENLRGNMVIVQSQNTERHVILSQHQYLSAEYYDMRSGNQITETEYHMLVNMGAGHMVEMDVSARAEGAFLSAIISVTNTEPTTIGFALGYGEARNPYMEELLAFNAYGLRFVEISELASESTELDLLIINAPQADYSREDIAALENWLRNDGNFGKTLLYFAHHNADTPLIDTYLRNEWLVSVEREYVVQRDPRFIAPISIAGMQTEIQQFVPLRFEENLNPAFRIFGNMMRYVMPVEDVVSLVGTIYRTEPILISQPGAYSVPFETPITEFDYAAAQSSAFPVGVISTVETYGG